MTEPSTVQERLPITLPAVIAQRDGTNDAAAISMLIMVESRKVSIIEQGPILRSDAIHGSVDNYLRGKNLAAVLDFPPTARNLAAYLARVFRSIDPDVCRVAVGYDGGSTYFVEFEDE